MSESVGSVYVDVLPDARKFSPELKAKLRDLSVDVGLNLDDKAFRAKLDEAARNRAATIRVNADATKANAEIDKAARTRTAKIKVKADKSSLSELRSMLNPGGMGLLGSLVVGLGPALIPMTAAVGGLGAALAAPVLATGGGLTVGGILAGAAVKQTDTQLKQIDALRKKADAARSTLAQARLSAGSSAANSLAGAQRTRDNALASAHAALSSATTPAARAAAERRIASAEAAFSARQAAIAASQTARVTAAQRKATDATQQYRKALHALTPEQRKLMQAQGNLKGAFQNLLSAEGPQILGPVVAGLDAMAKVLPHLNPLIDGVSHGVGVLLSDVERFASGPGFDAMLKPLGHLADTSIVSFGRDLENVATGAGHLFKAFEPLTSSVMKGLEGMTSDFAKWSEHVGDSSAFHHFLTYVSDNGPKVGHTIGDLATAAGHIAAAMAPWGSVVLSGLEGFSRFLAHAKPGTIEAIATATGGLALAFGKGPLGLATAVGAVAVHSPGVLHFLQTAGKLAGDFADAFDKMPESMQMAAAAAVGIGAIGLKLKGTGLGKGALGGGGILGALGKAKPVPVYVVNEGFGGAGAIPVGKGGKLASVLEGASKAAVPVAIVAASAVALKAFWDWNHGGSHNSVLSGGKAGDWARSHFGTPQDPNQKGNNHGFTISGGPLGDWGRSAFDKSAKSAEGLNKQVEAFNRAIGLLPPAKTVHFKAPELPWEIAAVQKYGSMLDGLPRSVKTKLITERIAHVQGQLDRFNGGKIPVGATGGIVTRPTVALIGEKKPEAVIPLSSTPGSSALPKGGLGGVHINVGTVQAHDYRDFMKQMNSRARARNGGGVTY